MTPHAHLLRMWSCLTQSSLGSFTCSQKRNISLCNVIVIPENFKPGLIIQSSVIQRTLNAFVHASTGSTFLALAC